MKRRFKFDDYEVNLSSVRWWNSKISSLLKEGIRMLLMKFW